MNFSGLHVGKMRGVIRISLIILFNLYCLHISAQAILEEAGKESIRSIQFHREGWVLSYPVMELHGPDRLVLSFDDLGNDVKDYSYKIIHCDAFWTPSMIPEGDYMEGFYENHISEYALSFNTYHNYVNYKLRIPNDDVSLKISGNYILKIYEDFNEEQVVLTRRFVVAESAVDVSAVVGRPVMTLFRDNGHEVDVSVSYGQFPVNDPYSEFNLTICQNNRWDLAVYDLKPLFMGAGSLSYDYQNENVFPAGNEYRYFDIRSLRYQTAEISSIKFERPYNHVYLYPDKVRANQKYFYQEDFNGRYYVEIQEGTKDDLEADYVYVHFTLPYDVPLIDGDVYVFGAFTDWSTEEWNRMEYNYEEKSYQATLPVKQGYYNYEYVFVNKATGYRDAHFMEGSHYETENNYVIYLYYSDQVNRYDRVIGHQIVNSVRR